MLKKIVLFVLFFGTILVADTAFYNKNGYVKGNILTLSDLKEAVWALLQDVNKAGIEIEKNNKKISKNNEYLITIDKRLRKVEIRNLKYKNFFKKFIEDNSAFLKTGK